jgi:predicted transcriptional regulator
MTNTVVEKINNLLKKVNFETFVLGNCAPKKSKFCFDLLVKKDDSVFSVKVFHNIDYLNPSLIQDIKFFSLILKSKPLLIGIRNRY